MDETREAELRGRVSDAVVQDFIDDLPRPLGVAELSLRLRVSRASTMHHVRRGHLVACRVDGRWVVDVEASDRFLREMIESIRARRPALAASAFDGTRTVYVPVRGAVIDRLAALMEQQHATAERVIEDLLADRVGAV
ncbi:helix-turn-helix domain-containing protein [Plantibacter sp. YIM 135249]|uniref:helix-turn-helix domain-containing protein n=1 Tax=Plantibacter sp. YIM 135249 TaxID=3423918 RepID=UPI003D33A1F9